MAERKLINNRENGMLNTCYIKNVSIMKCSDKMSVLRKCNIRESQLEELAEDRCLWSLTCATGLRMSLPLSGCVGRTFSVWKSLPILGF